MPKIHYMVMVLNMEVCLACVGWTSNTRYSFSNVEADVTCKKCLKALGKGVIS